jgi:hypothetical protein
MAKAIISYVRGHHVGLLALFVALSGTAYAATLPRNSVGTAQLKRSAVTSAKVMDGSLLGQDFRAGQLPAGAQGPQGPQGPQGAQGPQGQQGDEGPRGVGDAEFSRHSNTTLYDSSNSKASWVLCPSGAVATGGGHEIIGPIGQISVSRSTNTTSQAFSSEGWYVGADEIPPTTDQPWQLFVWVSCAA